MSSKLKLTDAQCEELKAFYNSKWTLSHAKFLVEYLPKANRSTVSSAFSRFLNENYQSNKDVFRALHGLYVTHNIEPPQFLSDFINEPKTPQSATLKQQQAAQFGSSQSSFHDFVQQQPNQQQANGDGVNEIAEKMKQVAISSEKAQEQQQQQPETNKPLLDYLVAMKCLYEEFAPKVQPLLPHEITLPSSAESRKIDITGQAIVFKADYNVVNKFSIEVAVKVFKDQPAKDAQKLAYTQEVSKLEKLKHKNILPIVRFYHHDVILVTPWMKNETLDRQRTTVYNDPTLMLKIFIEVADALVYVHSKRVVHLDIKPNNVLLDENFNAYVADFGLAHDKKHDDAAQMSTVQDCGTPGFVAPEVKTKQGNMKSDVYSFGMLIYNVITGKKPNLVNYIQELDNTIADAKENPKKQSMLIQLKALIIECTNEENSARPDSNALVSKLKQILHAYNISG